MAIVYTLKGSRAQRSLRSRLDRPVTRGTHKDPSLAEISDFHLAPLKNEYLFDRNQSLWTRVHICQSESPPPPPCPS